MVINSHTIQPLDEEGILKAAKLTGAIVTVEEHQIAGGLGSTISEFLAKKYPVPIEFIGVKDNVAKDIFLIIIGIGALVGGAYLLVHSAIYFARVIGISELVIGLTVIAVGTSIPELATSMVAAIRKESDISVGNVLGSNIFNILAVLGIAAIIQPLRVNSASLRVDMPVMLFFSIFLIPIITWKFVLTRGQGVLLLIWYCSYVFWLFK